MESTDKIMCLYALERMFCKCLLVYFKLMWNVNELNQVKKGTSDILEGDFEYVQT